MKRTAWFRAAGWGVFCHYLGAPRISADEWNRRVDAFDAEALADRLASAGVPYFMLSIGQNSGHYCSPNATYDEIVGIRPSKCSRRDLIADLSAALSRRGIPLMCYLASNAPSADPVAVRRLDWAWGCREPWPAFTRDPAGRDEKRLVAFQRKWEAVIREWSRRWGRGVAGWWIDGCYFADTMYRHPEEPNFHSFAAALRAGNPDAIVAFNPDVYYPVRAHSEDEDYTAGEVNDFLPICPGPYLCFNGHKVQWHMATFLGQRWGTPGEPRFSDELVAGFTNDVINRGGVITWDVHITPNGEIPDSFMRAIGMLGQRVKKAGG